MSYFRAVSLFSNCGAGDVGYRDAGFRFDVMAELDPERLKVCLLNHPDATGVQGDLRTTWETVVSKYRARAGKARPALLCACPPCQGMSSARSGKGAHEDPAAGSKDERNLLVVVIVKVAKRLMPSIIVVENVSAFLTRKVHHPKDGRPVAAANYLIEELAKDYVPFPLCADLSAFGIPQSRTRSFITLIRKDVKGLKDLLRLGRAPFPKPTHVVDSGSRPITLEQALDAFGLPPLDAASKEVAEAEEYNGFHSVPVWNSRTYAMVAAIPGGSGKSAWENQVCVDCGAVEVGAEIVLCPECEQPLLRPIVRDTNGQFRLIRGFKSSYRRMHMDKPASTVTTASGHIGSDYTIHPTQNRLLSPLECSLLQTFPANFEWGDAMTRIGHTNVREMIGEAVPPAFTRQHGEVLIGVLRQAWKMRPISQSDDRCTKAWDKLVGAAKKDGRMDPHARLEQVVSVPGSKGANFCG